MLPGVKHGDTVAQFLDELGMAISIYPTWDYIDFMQIQKSASLRIPFHTIFSVYLIFLIAMVASYGWRTWLILTGRDPDSDST